MSGCCGPSDKLNIDILNIAQQDCDPDVHCVPSTDGKPTDDPPENKKDIIRRDPCTKKVWLYTCDGGWKEIEFSLCSLEELDSSVINNICETLRIPAFYDSNGCCVQGSFSLQDLADIIEQCLCPPDNGVITLEEGISSDDWVHVSDDECNVTRKKLAFNYDPPAIVSVPCADQPLVYDPDTQTTGRVETGYPSLTWAVEGYPLAASFTSVSVTTDFNVVIIPTDYVASAECATHALIDVSVVGNAVAPESDGYATILHGGGSNDMASYGENNMLMIPLSHTLRLTVQLGTINTFYKLVGFVKAI